MAMKHFFVGVKAVIINNGNVFLVKGEGSRDFWDCPGGRIDDNESIADTLERELHEELPNIVSYRATGIVHAVRVHKDIVDDVSLTLLFFKVEDAVFNGDPEISNEHIEGRWFPIDEAMMVCKDNIREALASVKA